MGVDWEYLRGIEGDPTDFGENELEELYQSLAGISKLRPRDKTSEKLEMLFTLTQAVMMAKNSKVTLLEVELGELADSAGRGDAHREKQLIQEIEHLKMLLQKSDSKRNGETTEEDIAYDWSSGWKIKKKQMEKDLAQKNEEILQFMDDIQSLEAERDNFKANTIEFEQRLVVATQEINSVTSELISLRDSHAHIQECLAEAQNEIEGIRSHTEELVIEKAALQQNYDQLSTEVDARVDQLQIVLTDRESELKQLRSQIHHQNRPQPGFMQQSMIEYSQLQQLQQEVKKRDTEIEHLTEKLKEAATEIDNSAQIITKLKKNKKSLSEGEATVVSSLRGELNESRQHLAQMRTQLLAAEEDAQMHAQNLATAIGELQAYMAGEFTLGDAVRELKEARNQVRIRDTQISQLTTLVNSLQININDVLEENTQLRDQLKLSPRQDIKLPGVRQSNWQDSKNIIERLTNKVNKLQDERVNLRTKVYELTRELSNVKGSLQVTALQMPHLLTQGSNETMESQINQLSHRVSELIEAKSTEQQQETSQLSAQLQDLRDKCARCSLTAGHKTTAAYYFLGHGGLPRRGCLQPVHTGLRGVSGVNCIKGR
ncbi:unnamed protein product, partial [Meganyctiphanes norvegica]